LLPSDNFEIEVISETCVDKNNGQIRITASASYNYTAIVNGINYSFTNNTLILENLETGPYEVCVLIEEQSYRQCYNLNIAEGVIVSGKASVGPKSVNIELDQGTAPFTVYVDGIEIMRTTNSEFEVAINHSSLVEVKTSIDCEGVFSKEILLESFMSIYPNPTTNSLHFIFPIEISEIEVTIFSLLGENLFAGSIYKNKPSIDISFLPKGLYMFQLKYNDIVKTKKVLKN